MKTSILTLNKRTEKERIAYLLSKYMSNEIGLQGLKLQVQAIEIVEEKCPKCGQVDKSQTGEYPCPKCGLPTMHDEEKETLSDKAIFGINIGDKEIAPITYRERDVEEAIWKILNRLGFQKGIDKPDKKFDMMASDVYSAFREELGKRFQFLYPLLGLVR